MMPIPPLFLKQYIKLSKKFVYFILDFSNQKMAEEEGVKIGFHFPLKMYPW